MKVKVLTLATLYTITGKLEHEVTLREGATVLDAINRIVEMYPALKEEVFDEGKPSSELKILVNGRPVEYAGGLNRKLRESDVIVLIPPAGGGHIVKDYFYPHA